MEKPIQYLGAIQVGKLELENENERYAAAKEKLLGDKIPEWH